MSPRIQCFLFCLLKYHFQLQPVPARQFVLTDMLSRASAGAPEKDKTYEDVEVTLSSLESRVVQDRLARETRNDCYLKSVMEHLERNEPVERQLRSFTDELSVISGVLLKGNKAVILVSLWRAMLSGIHDSHMGTNKCKA